jgi:hypothetical protein
MPKIDTRREFEEVPVAGLPVGVEAEIVWEIHA